MPGESPPVMTTDRVRLRLERLLREAPPVPAVKALLSRDGGVCPEDGATLRFDPWSPDRHRCPDCGKETGGPRHHAHWARAQHLWLAERLADLGVLAVTGDRAAAARANELLERYETLYFDLPNRDNVLGPSHLFFSTYLESLWVTQWLAGAVALREAGLLSDARVEGVNRVADEAATLIAEFNEGMSNRQTWNAAALTAIAAWFGDEELAQTAIESRTGLLGHLADGFGDDGLWWEGENYHLFALRGLMTGMYWARMQGVDLLEDDLLRQHFRDAVLGPGRSALPDLTYPARKDARYGVSLAQPAHLELFDVGRSWVGADAELDGWVAALMAVPPQPAEHWDAWLHEAGLDDIPSDPRARLSGWALAAMAPDTPAPAGTWTPTSTLLSGQGLAVLRTGDRYVSLECGRAGGGHGHPDRLHLTLHAAGVHWLPDPGTGSYVDPSLAWYRSALAHNAPLPGGKAPGGTVRAEAFDHRGTWAWARGRAGEVTRTVVTGPAQVVDIVESEGSASGTLDLPWHFQGDVTLLTPGRWESAGTDAEFVTAVERFVPDQPAGGVSVACTAPGGARLTAHLQGHAELFRLTAPGLPGRPTQSPFLLQRVEGPGARLVAVLTLSATETDQVRRVQVDERSVMLGTGAGEIAIRWTGSGTRVVTGGETVELAGLLPAPPAISGPFVGDRGNWDAVARAPRLWDAPALDGSLGGFDTGEPLVLEGEHHYHRSEEPWDPEAVAARAWVNWDVEALYIAVEVDKPDLLFRAADAPPLDLDNEPDDIHSDGLQVHLRFPDNDTAGVLVVPEEGGGLRVRATSDTGGDPPEVTGRWTPTETGYAVTLRLADVRLGTVAEGDQLGFDLVVNEMRPDRVRRAGQLIWSGGGGWVYLRGDRHDPARLGRLELG